MTLNYASIFNLQNLTKMTKTELLVNKTIKELKDELVKEGYEVTADLPTFLEGQEIDLIATNGEKNVAINVRHIKGELDAKKLGEVTKTVKTKKNWSHELTILNPQTTLEKIITRIYRLLSPKNR